MRAGQHRSQYRALRAQLRAALLAARGDDGAAGTGTHAGAEAVLTGTAAVVGLVSPLGHGVLLRRSRTARGHRRDAPAPSRVKGRPGGETLV